MCLYILHKIRTATLILVLLDIGGFTHQATLVAQDGVNEETGLKRFEHQFNAMGAPFKFIAYAESKKVFADTARRAEKRVHELDATMSDYDETSEVSQIMKSAPHEQPIGIGKDLRQVLQLSRRISFQTKGTFDPTIGSVTKVWRMARKRNRLPRPSEIASAVSQCGWKFVELDANKIKISSPRLRFDFGGIGKGFAADAAVDVFVANELHSVLIDAGGDIRIGNPPPYKKGWKLEIRSGYEHLKPERIHQEKSVLLSNCAIATSGDAKQFLIHKGTRYSHIIDPRSGNPVTISRLVTVVADCAAKADALASAFSVLDETRSFEVAKSIGGVHARIVTLSNDATLEVSKMTPGFYDLFSEPSLADPATRFSN